MRFLIFAASAILSLCVSAQSIFGTWQVIEPNHDLYQFSFNEDGSASLGYGSPIVLDGKKEIIVAAATGEFGHNDDWSKLMLVIKHSSVHLPNLSEAEKQKHSVSINEWKTQVADRLVGQMLLTVKLVTPTNLTLETKDGTTFNLTRRKK